MNGLFLMIFGLLPAIAHAVPGRDVYPNSGPTDARVDENTDISPATMPSETDSPEAHEPQREEEDAKTERPIKKDDDFLKGPYDKNGNYRYIPEVRE